jgi:putative tricarboxylic transport membrane protein
MKKLQYEPVPLVLAFVLGRMAEESLRQSLVLSRGSLMIFFARPISAAFLIAAAALVAVPFAASRLKSAARVASGSDR